MRSFESDETVSLPLSKGGLGLRSAVRSRVAAHWASWADCLPMVQAPASCRHHIAGAQRRSPNHQFERCERVRHVLLRRPVVSCPFGWIWSMESALRFHLTWATHVSQGKGGRISCRTRWKNATCTRHFARCFPRNALSFGLRVDPSLRDHSCVPDFVTHEVPASVLSAFCSFRRLHLPLPFVFPQLPVWPSPRLLWPLPVRLVCR